MKRLLAATQSFIRAQREFERWPDTRQLLAVLRIQRDNARAELIAQLVLAGVIDVVAPRQSALPASAGRRPRSKRRAR